MKTQRQLSHASRVESLKRLMPFDLTVLGDAVHAFIADRPESDSAKLAALQLKDAIIEAETEQQKGEDIRQQQVAYLIETS